MEFRSPTSLIFTFNVRSYETPGRIKNLGLSRRLLYLFYWGSDIKGPQLTFSKVLGILLTVEGSILFWQKSYNRSLPSERCTPTSRFETSTLRIWTRNEKRPPIRTHKDIWGVTGPNSTLPYDDGWQRQRINICLGRTLRSIEILLHPFYLCLSRSLIPMDRTSLTV